MRLETKTRVRLFKKATTNDTVEGMEDGTHIDPEQISEMAKEFVDHSNQSAMVFVANAADHIKGLVKYTAVATGAVIAVAVVMNTASEVIVKKTHAN